MPKQTPTQEQIEKRGTYLRCCCCGNGTRGRQWWNRDKGFGLCDDCIDFNGVSNIPIGGTSSSFGVRGYNWDINWDKNE